MHADALPSHLAPAPTFQSLGVTYSVLARPNRAVSPEDIETLGTLADVYSTQIRLHKCQDHLHDFNANVTKLDISEQQFLIGRARVPGSGAVITAAAFSYAHCLVVGDSARGFRVHQLSQKEALIVVLYSAIPKTRDGTIAFPIRLTKAHVNKWLAVDTSDPFPRFPELSKITNRFDLPPAKPPPASCADFASLARALEAFEQTSLP